MQTFSPTTSNDHTSSNLRLQCHLLRLLRGEQSQHWISRRLSYQFNKYSQWESGRVLIKWSEFVKCCHVKKLDLSGVLRELVGFAGDIADGTSIVVVLLARCQAEVAIENVGRSVRKLNRLAKGRQQPRLLDVFALLDASGLKNTFLHMLSVRGGFSISEGGFASVETLRQAYGLHPAGTAILPYLRSRKYRDTIVHNSRMISEDLGIPVEIVDAMIEKLLAAGIIVPHQARFKAVKGPPSGSYIWTPSEYQQRSIFWLEKVTNRVRQSLGKNPIMDVFVRPVTQEAWEQIHRLREDYQRQAHAIIDKIPLDGDYTDVLVFGGFDYPVIARRHFRDQKQ